MALAIRQVYLRHLCPPFAATSTHSFSSFIARVRRPTGIKMDPLMARIATLPTRFLERMLVMATPEERLRLAMTFPDHPIIGKNDEFRALFPPAAAA
uniref:PORR domain-containing protein n=1 Tax=Panagrellus redivivus TaxID=6233 RepID=A0A7E4W8U2_PANRE